MIEEKRSTAAFFDLDGTLIPLPSLEQRFLRVLRYRKAIPARNYWLWLTEAVRLLPRGINAIKHANKMYLKGVQISDESDAENRNDSPGHQSGHQGEGQASGPLSKRVRRNPRLPVPIFFPAAFQRAFWHASQGHAIVLVSGTLEPLALTAAKLLQAGLRLVGAAVQIRVCATALEEAQGQWTGRIAGEAMYGEVKARAVKRLAEEMRLDLAQCWAYGDSFLDRWMLAAVGHPVAVNPSRKLARLAQLRGWPMRHWAQRRNLAERKASLPREPAPARDCQDETGREARDVIFTDGSAEQLATGVARSGSRG